MLNGKRVSLTVEHGCGMLPGINKNHGWLELALLKKVCVITKKCVTCANLTQLAIIGVAVA